VSAIITTPHDVSVRRRWLVLSLVLIAQFMVVLDATIVTVALPSVQTSLKFTSELNLQWVINAYSLFFGGFLLLGGRAGDLFGRQRLFVAGLALFTGASLVNGLAQSSEMLIIGRAVQGVGAALVSPAVLAILLVTFTDEGERGRALGYFTTVTASGSAAGLLLGGVLTNWLSWRWIFLVNVPIGVIGLVGALSLVPNSRVRSGGLRTLDLPGAVSVTAGLTLLVYTIVNAEHWGWGSARVLWLVVTAAVLLLAFVAIETRTRNPLIRLGIFAKRSLASGNITMFLMVAGLFTMMFFPTLYLAQISGYSPIKVGLAYLPWPVAMAAAGTLAQRLSARVSPRVLLAVGLAIVAAGLLTFARLPEHGSYAADVLPGMLLTAIGAGLAWANIFVVATTGVSHEESGLAAGIVNTSQQLGAALGLAVLSSIAAAHTSHILEHVGSSSTAAVRDHALVQGFQRGFLIGGVIVAVGALAAMLGVPRPDRSNSPQSADDPALVRAEESEIAATF
jgi:EmrB/QacA subfamily drug resistance transporter